MYTVWNGRSSLQALVKSSSAPAWASACFCAGEPRVVGRVCARVPRVLINVDTINAHARRMGSGRPVTGIQSDGSVGTVWALSNPDVSGTVAEPCT